MTPSKLLQLAPDFIVARFTSVITGLIGGYVFMLIFFGGGRGFLSRLLQISELLFGLYVVSRVVRFLNTTAVAAIDKYYSEPSASKKDIATPSQD